MEHVNQTLFALVLHAHNTFDTLNPWLIALTFFLSWLSLALTAMHIVGHLLDKVESGHMLLAMLLGMFSFTVFGGAFLWLLGV